MEQRPSLRGSAGRPKHAAKKNGFLLLWLLPLLAVLIAALWFFLFSGKEEQKAPAASGVSSGSLYSAHSKPEHSPPSSAPLSSEPKK